MIGGMANTGVAIRLPAAERTQLEQWESSFGTPQQVALRCRIVLAALAGQDNVSIAQELGVSRPTVQLWRKRVGTQGIAEVWEIGACQWVCDGIVNLAMKVSESQHETYHIASTKLYE